MPRFVIDSSTLISRLLLPASVPAQATQKALATGEVLFSRETLEELRRVLGRPKFNRYLTAAEREQFIDFLVVLGQCVELVQPVRACRDPNDDMFLSLAVSGEADVLITSDKDLLALDPFMTTRILTPRAFLAWRGEKNGCPP